ncbi:MAG: PQQ-dependent sugar dehydrogenase [Pseudomonadota bacterium]
MAFISAELALIGQRSVGKLSLLTLESGEVQEIAGLPEMLKDGSLSAGLFDIHLAHDFAQSRQVYLLYAVGTKEASTLALARATLDEHQLTNLEVLFEATPRLANKWHFGGRMVQVGTHLYFSTGDGYDHKDLAQDLSAHSGKILRLNLDGSVPADNPFVNVKGAQPEIWSYGVRNPQGMAVHPKTGDIWFNDHGPQGGDEINIATAGTNFGWPVITYGEEYGGGPIGNGITHKDGMAQPLYYWVPSIAPSGMTFYSGGAFPAWQGSAFSGALILTHINRVDVTTGPDRVMHEERLLDLDDKNWRVRFVEEGPDGYLYFGVDQDGKVMRLVPVE